MLEKYANLLVNYCLYLQPGEKLYINTSTLAEPLVKEIYKAALQAGAHVDYQLNIASANKIYFDHASDDQLNQPNELTRFIMSTYDAYLHIRAPHNMREDQNIDRQKSKIKGEVNKEINEIYSQRTADGKMKRALCQYPTQAAAQEAGMSLDEYEHFVYSACKLCEDDPIKAWQEVGKNQQKIVDYLNKCETIRYVNPKTDISYSVKGRTWINSDGKANMPSGEVFTGPVEDSVNGHIYFDYPSIYSGNEVRGITLQVEHGKVVKWDADHGAQFLDTIFDIEGSRFFGEAAIGTNYSITHPTKNILFDEKIGGTVHMAIGQSYYHTGGKNESTIHWDMIADMRNEGKVYANDVLIYENGYFLGELGF